MSDSASVWPTISREVRADIVFFSGIWALPLMVIFLRVSENPQFERLMVLCLISNAVAVAIPFATKRAGLATLVFVFASLALSASFFALLSWQVAGFDDGVRHFLHVFGIG